MNWPISAGRAVANAIADDWGRLQIRVRALKLVVHVDGELPRQPGARRSGGRGRASADGEVLDEATELLGVDDEQRCRVSRAAPRARPGARLGATEVELINDSELIAKQLKGSTRSSTPR